MRTSNHMTIRGRDARTAERREMLGEEHLAIGEDERALDHVPQLADVPRPAPGRQPLGRASWVSATDSSTRRIWSIAGIVRLCFPKACEHRMDCFTHFVRELA